MFVVKLRPLCLISDRIIVRHIRNNRLSKLGSNPGLDRRIKAFQKDGLNIENDDAEEYIEKSESDFGNVGVSYNEHLNETLIGKYELRHHIIKEKYFKENMPNLLTWSEKEQIRHLVQTMPDEWPPEKIAESFPVTVPVIKKLLKYPWKPATVERIARHDASVIRNWRELKEGLLSIPEGLRQHFLKFSNRTIPPLNKESIKIDITKEQQMGEFERIVQRCAKNENSNTKQEFTEEQKDEHKEHRHKSDFKRMTLDQLTEKIKKRMETSNNININDELIIKTVNNTSPELVRSLDPTNLELSEQVELYAEDKGKELSEYKKQDTEVQQNIMDYPERIRIPKKAYKKGATYKVNDCYYDHDGKFLYRVLGM